MARSLRRQGSQASGLERAIRRFQHRWETEPQYRARMSGVLGLLVLVGLLGGVFAVGSVANLGLSALGIGKGQSGPIGPVNTGSKLVNGTLTFPTPTVVLTLGSAPAPSPIPNSQTPIPSPTPSKTPTATPTAEPSPTDQPSPTATASTGPLVCTGGGNGITYTLTPCPQIHGQNGTITITAPRKYAGAGLRVLLILNQNGTCTDCNKDYTNLALDANAAASITYAIPNDAANNPTPIGGLININGGPGTTINASPVQ